MINNILVAGGAGYIGSHVVKKLKLSGYTPIIFDNLSTGHKEAIADEVLVVGDVRNPADLDKAFTDYNITAVMHFCAKSLVGESMEHPELYFENNVIGGFHLLEAMRKHNVKHIIFSSTAATFGEPKEMPITEETRQIPTNPYGESKLMFEKMLKWYDISHGIKSCCLRYFNAAGADDDALIGEDHKVETHLIPIIFQVVNNQREYIGIFGEDYPTKDGTCIRDYIHIYDLAKAHILSLKYIIENNTSEAFNLGCGKGYSVKEIIEEVEKVVGSDVEKKITDRRPGDPTELIASSAKITHMLGWQPDYDLENIIKSASNWHLKHPQGYKNEN